MRLNHLTAANDILNHAQALAARYAHDGCLLVREVLGTAEIEALTEQAAAALQRWGIASAAPHQDELRWNGTPLGCRDPDDLDTIPALTTLIDGFNTPTQPLRGVIDRICGHPMHLWRNAYLFTAIPDDPAYVTRPHQDAFALSATGDYRRVWVALTAIPFADGGLAVALGSHHAGRLPQREFPELKWRTTLGDPASTTPVRGVDPELVNDHWHTAEFHPGDALIFHSDLLHRGLPATSDRIRIALGIVASGETDPRPAATFTQPENRARKRRARELATVLDLSEDQLAQVHSDLLMTGQPVTVTTMRSALAGDHEHWRQHAPGHQATRKHS